MICLTYQVTFLKPDVKESRLKIARSPGFSYETRHSNVECTSVQSPSVRVSRVQALRLQASRVQESRSLRVQGSRVQAFRIQMIRPCAQSLAFLVCHCSCYFNDTYRIRFIFSSHSTSSLCG